MKKTLSLAILLISLFFLFIWGRDVFLRENSYKEPSSKDIVAFAKRPIASDLEVPDPLLSSVTNYDNIQLYIFLDVSGSVKAESIIQFYKKAAKTLENYSPRMYYFATCATQLSDDVWTNVHVRDIRSWRGEKCQLGIQARQTNLMAPINKLIDDIEDKSKEHIVLIVTDDIHETLKSYSISKNEPSFRAEVKAKLRRVMNEYNVNLNLIKLTGNKHRNDSECRTIKNYITNNFREFEVTTASNLNSLSNTLDNEIRKKLLLSDFNFSRPSGFDFPDIGDCNATSLDSTYIYNVEKRATHDQNIFVEFMGYPNTTTQKPVFLEKGKSSFSWFGFKIYNTYKFFPVEVRIKDIYSCGIPEISFQIPKEYEDADTKQAKNMTYFVRPGEELYVKIPIQANFNGDYKGKRFTNLQVSYDVEYLGRKKEELENILQRYPDLLSYNNSNYTGSYTQYCNVQTGLSEITTPPLIGTVSPWSLWHLPIFLLIVAFITALIPRFIAPNIKGWNIFVNKKRISPKLLKRRNANIFEINNRLLKSALPKHVELVPIKTKFGLNPGKAYRDDLKVKILGPVRVVDRNGKVLENVVRGAKTLKGDKKKPIYLDVGGVILTIY